MDIRESNAALIALRNENIARGVLTAHPLFVERAEGSRIWDTEGKEYLDFVGGIGVLNVGHNHPKVVAAVREQLKRVSHAAFQVMGYDVYLQLAKRLEYNLSAAPSNTRASF